MALHILVLTGQPALPRASLQAWLLHAETVSFQTPHTKPGINSASTDLPQDARVSAAMAIDTPPARSATGSVTHLDYRGFGPCMVWASCAIRSSNDEHRITAQWLGTVLNHCPMAGDCVESLPNGGGLC